MHLRFYRYLCSILKDLIIIFKGIFRYLARIQCKILWAKIKETSLLSLVWNKLFVKGLFKAVDGIFKDLMRISFKHNLSQEFTRDLLNCSFKIFLVKTKLLRILQDCDYYYVSCFIPYVTCCGLIMIFCKLRAVCFMI